MTSWTLAATKREWIPEWLFGFILLALGRSIPTKQPFRWLLFTEASSDWKHRAETAEASLAQLHGWLTSTPTAYLNLKDDKEAAEARLQALEQEHERLKASYDLKVEDFARETRRCSLLYTEVEKLTDSIENEANGWRHNARRLATAQLAAEARVVQLEAALRAFKEPQP